MWWKHSSDSLYPKPLAGDWFVIVTSCLMVLMLFSSLWNHQPANRLEVRHGDQIVGVYDLNQLRSLSFRGPLGISEVVIQQGKARFKHSPCSNQYCVHQGWLSKAGQVSICLPNHISLELLGAQKPYDSLNY